MAEVLAVVVVIGLVVFGLSIFVSNISENADSKRQADIAQNVTQAVEKMQVLGLLETPYQDTDAFVDELQRYLKVSQRCDSSNIAACWPADTVTTSDGSTYNVSDSKTGLDIGLDYGGNNVGLVLEDGSSIILCYNTKTEGIDALERIVPIYADLPIGKGKTKKFAYTSSAAKDIDFIANINGAKDPNSEPIDGKYYDVRSFRNARFTKTAN